MDSGNLNQIMDAAQLFRTDRLMLLLMGIVVLVLVVKILHLLKLCAVGYLIGGFGSITITAECINQRPRSRLLCRKR